MSASQVLAAFLLLVSVQSAPAQDVADAPRSHRDEFELIADGLLSGTNRYLGQDNIQRLRQALASPALTMEQRLNTHAVLTLRLLEAGAVDDAVAEVEALVSMVESSPDVSMMANLHRIRGLAFLRRAELENCVARHNGDCCIFPLRDGALHVDREPALQAAAAFRDFLEINPDDLKVIWLLNVVAMALGDYPEGVPLRWRLPPAAFESEYEIPRFRDVAPELGVDTLNLCGGVVVADFDGDGLSDIATSTYDPNGPLTLYHNDGDGGFDDWSTSSGADDQLGGLNMVGADYDNDGDTDLLILRGAWLYEDGRIRNSLLRNDRDAGRVRLVDVTREAGLAAPAQPTQVAAFADFDNDGWLDIYVGNESRVRSDPRANYPGQLFYNRRDGTFVDVARSAGVTNDRYCKGAAVGDFDNDGDMDLYLSNVGPNRLYRNNADGTFTDVAADLGVEEPAGRSFATWFFDYDNDGWLDLWVAAYRADVGDLAAEALGRPHQGEPPRLYRNTGASGTPGFEEVTATVGLDRVFLPMGANFGDIDNDGWLDMYVTTGDPDFQSLMPNVMLRNDRGLRFQDVTEAGGFGHLQKGHGVAFADLDRDGDQDIYHQLGGFFPGDRFHNVLFLNPGNGNRWVHLELVGTRSNRDAIGARIMVEVQTPAGNRRIHRAVGSVSSFGGSTLRQEVGLGDATRIVAIEVDWPASGRHQRITDVAMDRLYRVVEDREDIERVSVEPIVLGR